MDALLAVELHVFAGELGCNQGAENNHACAMRQTLRYKSVHLCTGASLFPDLAKGESEGVAGGRKRFEKGLSNAQSRDVQTPAPWRPSWPNSCQGRPRHGMYAGGADVYDDKA